MEKQSKKVDNLLQYLINSNIEYCRKLSKIKNDADNHSVACIIFEKVYENLELESQSLAFFETLSKEGVLA